MPKRILFFLILLLLSLQLSAGTDDASSSTSHTTVAIPTYSQLMSPAGKKFNHSPAVCLTCKLGGNPPPQGYYPTFGLKSNLNQSSSSNNYAGGGMYYPGFSASPYGGGMGYGGYVSGMNPNKGGGLGSPYGTNQESGEDKSQVSRMHGLMRTLIDKIPNKELKDGLNEYLRIVKPEAYGGHDSVGGSNAGIGLHFSELFEKNQCFKDSAIKFYKDVARQMNKQHPCEDRERDKEYNYGCFSDRPSLQDKAGAGNKTYLEEGWLMKLAMKHTGGSAQAALELIGMCGHDDVSQGKFQYLDTSEAGKQDLRDRIETYKEEKAYYDAELKKAFQGFDEDKDLVYQLSQQASFLGSQIEAFKRQTGTMRNLVCPPQNSDYYLQGSLDSTANIPENLKNKISNVQIKAGDVKDATFIPAKHYHVYGSAYLGCKMASQGMKPELAVNVQKQAARFYRSLRMCESTETDRRVRDEIKKSLNIDFENSAALESKVLELWKSFLTTNQDCYSTETTQTPPSRKKTDPEKPNEVKFVDNCLVLREFGISNLEANEEAIVKTKIQTALKRKDAAFLFNKWYFGGNEIAGKKVPCTDIRFRGPKDLLDPNKSLFDRMSKPSGWSPERYEAATRKLATWDVDFEWTIAQHEAGSRYGANLCSKQKDKKSPFESEQCKAVDGQFNNASGYGAPQVTQPAGQSQQDK